MVISKTFEVLGAAATAAAAPASFLMLLTAAVVMCELFRRLVHPAIPYERPSSMRKSKSTTAEHSLRF